MMSAEQPSPTAARAALTTAKNSADRVREQARWMSTYLAVFGAGFAVLTLVLGLVEPLFLRMALVSAGWPLLIGAMVVWATRRPATLRGTTGRVVKYWVGTAALYAIALVVGTPGLTGEALYWIPASIVVATPLLVGAVQERRA